MKLKEFFGKFASAYLWYNLLAMAVVVLLLCVGVNYGLKSYTRHGESIDVPNLHNMSYDRASALLDESGLNIVVSDSGYNKALPAGSILVQNPEAGAKVKSGRTIYVTVNSLSSPLFTIPDIVDNSSMREAVAKLTAIGFRLLDPQYVAGEKDWVYGIVCRGRHLSTGDRVSVEDPLTLVVGSGMTEDDPEDIKYTDPEYDTGESEFDEFEEVTAPPEGARIE